MTPPGGRSAILLPPLPSPADESHPRRRPRRSGPATVPGARPRAAWPARSGPPPRRRGAGAAAVTAPARARRRHRRRPGRVWPTLGTRLLRQRRAALPGLRHRRRHSGGAGRGLAGLGLRPEPHRRHRLQRAGSGTRGDRLAARTVRPGHRPAGHLRQRRDPVQFRRPGPGAGMAGRAQGRPRGGSRRGGTGPRACAVWRAAFEHLQGPVHARHRPPGGAADRQAARTRDSRPGAARSSAATARRRARHRRRQCRHGEHGGLRRPRRHRRAARALPVLAACGRRLRRLRRAVAGPRPPHHRARPRRFDLHRPAQMAQRALRQRGAVHAPPRSPGARVPERRRLSRHARRQPGFRPPDAGEFTPPARPRRMVRAQRLRPRRACRDRATQYRLRAGFGRTYRTGATPAPAGAGAIERGVFYAERRPERSARPNTGTRAARCGRGVHDAQRLRRNLVPARRVQQLASDA